MVAMTTLDGAASGVRRWPFGTTTRQSNSVWALGVAIVAPALAAVTLALHLVNGSTDFTGWWYGNPMLAVLLAGPGVLIVTKCPGSSIGWLLCVSSLSQGLCGAGREYFVYGTLGGFAPGWFWVGWFSDSLWIVTVAALPLLLMLFPDGRATLGRARVLLGLPIIAFVCAWFVLLAGGPGGTVHGHEVAHPMADLVSAGVLAAGLKVSLILIQGSLGVALVVLVLRYRRSSGEARLQMKWIVWAGSITAIEVGTEFLPFNTVSTYTGPAAVLLLSTAITIAIVRHLCWTSMSSFTTRWSTPR